MDDFWFTAPVLAQLPSTCTRVPLSVHAPNPGINNRGYSKYWYVLSE